jgi:hypothetical protein
MRWLLDAGRFLYAFVTRIPLIGGLTYCRPAHHALALREFFVLVLFGTATFWLSAFIAQFLNVNKDKQYLDLLPATYSNGEILIFCVGFLGPVFYTAVSQPKDSERDFPERAIHICVTAAMLLISAALYGAMKTGAEFDQAKLMSFSGYVFFICIVLRYLTIVYARSLDQSPNDVRRQGTEAFMRAAAERKRD